MDCLLLNDLHNHNLYSVSAVCTGLHFYKQQTSTGLNDYEILMSKDMINGSLRDNNIGCSVHYHILPYSKITR